MMDEDGNWAGPKSAQMGFTEVALNRTFFTIDIKKTDVIYLLPKSDPDASDFSSARFTPALELSPHLKDLFTEANNVGYKRAGAVSLYVRGMQSRSGVKSLATGLMIFDELDEMPSKNVELAKHRTAGQLDFQTIKISTPTIPGFGIDLVYKESTKDHYYFKCPFCSRMTELTYPECIVITADSIMDSRIKESYYICKECKHALPHEGKIDFLKNANKGGTGEWASTENFDSETRGFHIHRMYSMAKSGTAPAFAEEKLRADTDLTCKQEFFNSVLGRAFVVEGAQILDDAIAKVTKSYSRNARPRANGFRVMGIDVGNDLHYEIGEFRIDGSLSSDLNALSTYVQLTAGKVQHFEDLDPLMRDYQILTAVIDANPERRKAREFASRFPNHVYLCFYANGLRGNEVTVNKTGFTISVDRTSWLDMSIGRFNSGRISIPGDTLDEYKEHIKAVIRKYDRDHNGNPVGVWVSTGADHFAHARNYAEIALPLAATLTTNRDIESFL